MPAPQMAVLQVLPDGKERAVLRRIWVTCADVKVGLIESTSEATPATWGAAMLVPAPQP